MIKAKLRPLRTRWQRVWRSLRPPPAPPPASPLTWADAYQGLPDWTRLINSDWHQWQTAVRRSRRGPKILLATSVGGNLAALNVESLLAVALTLRGANVHLLLCDGLLPGCQMAISGQMPPDSLVADGPQAHLCAQCAPPAQRALQALGLPVHTYSQFVTAAERSAAQALAGQMAAAEIGAYREDGLAVGEHALAGALRYFARGTLDGEPQGEAVLRRYFEASLLTTAAARRLLGQVAFKRLCLNHGIYVPQGLIAEVARQAGLPLATWNPAYRKHCFIFSHHDTYHHTLISEPIAHWENLPWTPAMEADLMAYLKSRWHGTRDWIWFHEVPEDDVSALAARVGLDLTKPMVGLLTNVMWDAQLHYPANAFPNMLEWVLETVRYFATRPDLQLVIRIHPAELRGTIPSRQRLADELAQCFPQLPPNVFVIKPDDPISTYALLERCQAALIYGTKMGVELTSLGMPVVVAGEAWIRNKGLTYDANSRDGYLQLLARLPHLPALDAAATRRARQYAYHFFMRRMIPLPMVVQKGEGAAFGLQLAGLHALRPGRSPGLDVICDGLLRGSEFIFPAERQPATPVSAAEQPAA